MSPAAFVAVVVIGFVTCAEFGSYAFVHPVIRRLPPAEHLRVEQGLLRTFGRIMPAGMTAAPMLSLLLVMRPDGAAQTAAGPVLLRLAAASLTLALISTIAVNVGINRSTGTWDPDRPPADWKRTRDRWERFQALRSWLLLLGFALLVGSQVTW